MRLSELVQAGIFGYPPAMYATIVKWVDATIAGHYLAKANEELEKVKTFDPKKDKDEDLKHIDRIDREVYNQVVDAYRRVEEKGEKEVRNPFGAYTVGPMGSPVGAIAYSLRRSLRTVGGGKEWYLECTFAFVPKVLGSKVTPEMVFHNAERSSQWPHSTVPFKHSETGKLLAREVFDQCIAKAKKAVESHMGTRHEESKIVELHLLKKECEKHTQKAKDYKTQAKRDFKVDLAGWTYLPEVIRGQEAKDDQKQAEKVRKTFEDFKAAVKRLRQVKDDETKRFQFGKQTAHVRVRERNFTSGKTEYDYLLYEDEKAYAGDYKELPELFDAVERYWVKPILEKKPAEYKDVEDFLVKNRIDSMHVVIFFQPHKKRGGQWNWTDKEIQVDAHISAPSVDAFKRTFMAAHVTLQHELQHVGQDYLAVLKGLHEDAGLPSKSIREKGVAPSGVPLVKVKDDKGKTKEVPITQVQRTKKRDMRIDHPRRDVEFYTDLKETVDYFVKALDDVAIPKRKQFFDEYLGIIGPGTSRYFKTWKSTNREKWQKAVKEFTKAVSDLGVTLSMASVRRAYQAVPKPYTQPESRSGERVSDYIRRGLASGGVAEISQLMKTLSSFEEQNPYPNTIEDYLPKDTSMATDVEGLDVVPAPLTKVAVDYARKQLHMQNPLISDSEKTKDNKWLVTVMTRQHQKAGIIIDPRTQKVVDVNVN